MVDPFQTLEKLFPGWSKFPVSGGVCNPAIYGGIIDFAAASREWFVIFNDDRPTLEGFESLGDAIEAFLSGSLA